MRAGCQNIMNRLKDTIAPSAGSTEPTERLRERIKRNAIANRQKRMRSECTQGVIGYWLSAVGYSKRASSESPSLSSAPSQ